MNTRLNRAADAPHNPSDDSANDAAALAAVAARYAVAITPAMEALIDPSDPDDPIARQFRPDKRELDSLPAERGDPIADRPFSPLSGVVHRYPDRCLLKVIHVCPVYCRFCFRREMVGPSGEGSLNDAELDAALGYIAADPRIWEVILTGGDPFLLSVRRAADITGRLAAIPHVKVVRWHTRIPLVDPSRVTPEFATALRAEGVATWVALHANHPREFTPAGAAAIARLVDAGIPLVSQSVLLKGVNDDPGVLEALMRCFVEHRVKPYYLHQGDLAPGTSHLRTSIEAGQDLVAGLHHAASGLCQPTYVIDAPDGSGKAPLTPAFARRTEAGGWLLLGRDGCWRPCGDDEAKGRDPLA
ncbi:lysine-2,3-aminomutase-like protein [bacterium]|nr:lysine-2,3-aminomutase-like protein [bacterium]